MIRYQLPRSTCTDLYQDRLMNCYWGRLTCEILIDESTKAQGDIKQMEQDLNQVESSVPAGQILQSRCWLLHYSLYLFSRHPEDLELFSRIFLRREWVFRFRLTLDIWRQWRSIVPGCYVMQQSWQ